MALDPMANQSPTFTVRSFDLSRQNSIMLTTALLILTYRMGVQSCLKSKTVSRGKTPEMRKFATFQYNRREGGSSLGQRNQNQEKAHAGHGGRKESPGCTFQPESPAKFCFDENPFCGHNSEVRFHPFTSINAALKCAPARPISTRKQCGLASSGAPPFDGHEI
jgi:hypothetical protein